MLTLQPEQCKKIEEQERATLNALIGEQVIHVLGKPDGLRKVQVRRLWEDHFRVNVLIGEYAASVKVANSYFLKATRDGNIVESSPKITRQN